MADMNGPSFFFIPVLFRLTIHYSDTLKRGANNSVSQRSGLDVFPFAINPGRSPWLEGLISPIKSVTTLSFMRILYHASHPLAFLETKINPHIQGD